MDIIGAIPAFGGFLTTALAFVIALSVIVAIHEYGHYIVGRWSGIHAEVFSLGFGPVLFSRVDKRGTRWQLAALPFGGYVKFLGDANAASGPDEEKVHAMPAEMQRHTMLGAPLWARAATVAAGPVFNFVLSILIFTGIGLTTGVIKDPLTVGKILPVPYEVSLQSGDELVAIDGRRLPSSFNGPYDTFMDSLPPHQTLTYTVLRDGREIDVTGPHPMTPVISQLAPQSAAYDIDMKVGDVFLAVDGEPIQIFEQLKDKVLAAEGKPLVVDVWRDGETLQFTLAPRRVDEPQPEGGFKTQWRIGIVGGMFFEPATEWPGLGTAFLNGILITWEIMQGSVSGLYHMITGAISSCNMSGPLGIAEVSGAMASQGTQSYIYFIGVLSAAVGLLNLFPIPVLDGGHLVFYAYEAVAKRAPSERALRILMGLGLALILTTMLFALSNDLFCP
ncbi:RIP metalloprotease RseP [Thalassobius vesicularis]|uniref:Zinc metalloprotease n=1 Tax=Thalassobius vesicularis TaxID=1294297 RepID=A0A4S3MA27_9RHOB|nr:RIP metalloprotease RseP [Thalassobius vesicularis]THD74930.1 RIP metalloprotease RseP [Thalassobius vesicularis]